VRRSARRSRASVLRRQGTEAACRPQERVNTACHEEMQALSDGSLVCVWGRQGTEAVCLSNGTACQGGRDALCCPKRGNCAEGQSLPVSQRGKRRHEAVHLHAGVAKPMTPAAAGAANALPRPCHTPASLSPRRRLQGTSAPTVHVAQPAP